MSDADPPDFWAPPELRRARKPHQCCECCGDIIVGERHWYFSGVWVGDFRTFRVCLACEELRKEIVQDCGEEYRPAFEALRDEYDEHYRYSGGMELRR